VYFNRPSFNLLGSWSTLYGGVKIWVPFQNKRIVILSHVVH